MSLEPLRDPRYIALQYELRKFNLQMQRLIDILKPSTSDLDIKTISKASTFTDTEVMCQGFDLIQINTDGDLSTVSYKLVQLDGRDSMSMQAAESPHILGPITAVKVTSDLAETGKNVRVVRYRSSPLAIASIRHGSPQSTTILASARHFYAEVSDYTLDATNIFSTDQPMGTLPTLYLTGSPAEQHIHIDTIKFQFTTTAGTETYQLYLLEAASADDNQSEGEIIFDSGAGLTNGTIYIQSAVANKLPTSANLTTAGRIYYMIDWSAAPTNSTGYIKIYGKVLK